MENEGMTIAANAQSCNADMLSVRVSVHVFVTYKTFEIESLFYKSVQSKLGSR